MRPSPLATALLLAAALCAPAPGQCLTTLFGANGGTSVGGAVFFDLTAAGPLVVESLDSNLLAAAGTPVDLEVYARAGTHAGFESSPAGWALVSAGDGAAVAAGFDQPTRFTLAPPFALPAGVTGIALVAIGSGHARTNGNGANQQYSDGFISTSHGSSSNAPFSGTAFVPRVWNGTLCYRPLIGTSFCGPAVANSTGSPATLLVSGASVLAANDLRLTVLGAPPAAAVLAITSRTTGSTPLAGGQGTLCLGGAIGRFAPQVVSASAAGAAAIDVDLTRLPTPTGLVAAAPGESWSFQAWYRDANPTATSNFTDAVTVTF